MQYFCGASHHSERITPLTISNLLTFSRLIAVPALLVAAVLRHPLLFLWLLAYALLSDVIDGRLARWLRQESPLGARLDSIADCALYLTAPFAIYMLFPWMHPTLTVTLVVIYVAYLAPIAVGFVKYRRLTAYHTTGARVAAVVLAAGLFMLLATHHVWPVQAAAGILLLSGMEELAITWMLPEWRSDVRSVWHAAQLHASV